MSKEKRMQNLLDETLTHGCVVKAVTQTDALEFIEGVVKLYQEWELDKSKRKPDFSQVSRILMREWKIDIDRRKISGHVRGECKCPKK
jgi:hypothetical protein